MADLRWAHLIAAMSGGKIADYMFDSEHIINPEGWRTLTKEEVDELERKARAGN